MKIFIVEDTEIVRGILTDELSRIDGVEICGMADDPDQAIASILEINPDFVTLDIVLRNGNGFQVLKSIRKDGAVCRVMVLTNYAFPHYATICKEMGADYFFDKSIEMDKAIGVIKGLAANELKAMNFGGQ